MDFSYAITATPEALRKALATVGRGATRDRFYPLLPLTEAEVARLLVAMGNSLHPHLEGVAPPNTQVALGPLFDALAAAALSVGCETMRYEPTKATRAYPANLPQERVAEVQVFNDGDAMLIVNATVESWTNVDIWLNQRYLKHVDALAAGQTLRIPLGEFWDVRGEGPFPGGLLRYYPPTPIRLVQIQTAPDAPLIGFLSIPTERELDAAQLKKDS